MIIGPFHKESKIEGPGNPNQKTLGEEKRTVQDIKIVNNTCEQ